jgi:hypothetical protein
MQQWEGFPPAGACAVWKREIERTGQSRLKKAVLLRSLVFLGIPLFVRCRLFNWERGTEYV